MNKRERERETERETIPDRNIYLDVSIAILIV